MASVNLRLVNTPCPCLVCLHRLILSKLQKTEARFTVMGRRGEASKVLMLL